MMRCASDACTDADVPAICGFGEGAAWLFELDERWLRRSINVLEFVGNAANVMIYPALHSGQIAAEGDNTNALQAVLGRSRSPDMQAAGQAARRVPSFVRNSRRVYLEAVAGVGNALTDAGSRGMWHEFYAIAAAAGVRVHWLRLADFPEVLPFFEDVLANTQERECTHANPPRFECGGCHASLSATERAAGVCPSCGSTWSLRVRGRGETQPPSEDVLETPGGAQARWLRNNARCDGRRARSPAVLWSPSLAASLLERAHEVESVVTDAPTSAATAWEIDSQWHAFHARSPAFMRHCDGAGVGLFAREPIRARRPAGSAIPALCGALVATTLEAADAHSRIALPPRMASEGVAGTLLGPAALINAGCSRCCNVWFSQPSTAADGATSINIVAHRAVAVGQQAS